MTIDEAIEKERKQAEMYRCEYECECDYYSKGFVDEHADEFDCIKKMYEHEQIAEWLEELKELRTTSCGYSKEDIELNRNAMYDKAIDDFINACKSNTLCQTFGLRQCDIEEIAEQLTPRGTNENSNKKKNK